MTARYRYGGSPLTGFESSGGLLRHSLSDSNARSHFSSHKNLLLSFNEFITFSFPGLWGASELEAGGDIELLVG